jgi:FtsZ-interacting cell division protein YlmF
VEGLDVAMEQLAQEACAGDVSLDCSPAAALYVAIVAANEDDNGEQQVQNYSENEADNEEQEAQNAEENKAESEEQEAQNSEENEDKNEEAQNAVGKPNKCIQSGIVCFFVIY